MILIVDNYDSFTYNLRQYIGEVTDNQREIVVYRNDKITPEQITKFAPRHIVLSPGPCTPNEAGISLELVRQLKGKIPILGVCLGHQAIGQACGGRVIRAREVRHGKTSLIRHTGKSIFAGLEQDFTATRYHSLVVERETLPACLEILATSPDDEIMGLVHRDHPTLIGVQFHPESILTAVGKQLLSNFLALRL